MHESGWGGGCLALRAASDSSFCSAIEASEQARRMAPLKSPSSSLVDTRAARDSSGLQAFLGRQCVECWGHGGSASSLRSLLTSVARLRWWPPQPELRKHREQNLKSLSQEASLFSSTTASTTEASLLAT